MKKTINQPSVNTLEVNEKPSLMRREEIVDGSTNWTNKLIRQRSKFLEKPDIVETVGILVEVTEAIIDDMPSANKFLLDGIPNASPRNLIGTSIFEKKKGKRTSTLN